MGSARFAGAHPNRSAFYIKSRGQLFCPHFNALASLYVEVSEAKSASMVSSSTDKGSLWQMSLSTGAAEGPHLKLAAHETWQVDMKKIRRQLFFILATPKKTQQGYPCCACYLAAWTGIEPVTRGFSNAC
jgi:hypothetical protein